MSDYPERIGRFRIVGRLGAGGMGQVFEGVDEMLGRRAAIKVLHDDAAGDETGRLRFLREARAAAAISHEHVGTIYEVGEDGDRLYLAMELIEGRNLRTLFAEERPDLRRTLTLAREIASGLAAAHRAGLVHRDLKPDNVMIDAKTGRAKVLDFGLAKLFAGRGEGSSGEEATMSPELAATLTREGTVMGSPGYMSPEQLQAQEVDARTDVWAFGVLLYELLTGRRPFEHESPVALLLAICTQPTPPLAEKRPDLPAELAAFIERCLAKSATDRPEDGAALEEAVSTILAQAASAPAPPHVEPLGSAPTLPSATPAAPVSSPTEAGASTSAPLVPPKRLPRSALLAVALILTAPLVYLAAQWGSGPGEQPATTSPGGLVKEGLAGAETAATEPVDAPQPSGGDAIGPARLDDAHPRPCRAEPDLPCAGDSVAWCHPEGERVACCARGLVPTNDGLCECPPGGSNLASAIASGCSERRVEAVAVRDVIEEAIRARLPRMRRCYEDARAENDRLAGAVSLHFHITPWGDLWDLRIDQSSVPSPEVQRCALDALRDLRFDPPFPGSEGLGVSYPVDLGPSEDTDGPE